MYKKLNFGNSNKNDDIALVDVQIKRNTSLILQSPQNTKAYKML